MKAREVHLHIGRLVVDPPPRGQAEGWSDAIGRALGPYLRGPGPADGVHAGTDVPGTIARRVATRIAGGRPDGGRHEDV